MVPLAPEAQVAVEGWAIPVEAFTRMERAHQALLHHTQGTPEAAGLVNSLEGEGEGLRQEAKEQYASSGPEIFANFHQLIVEQCNHVDQRHHGQGIAHIFRDSPRLFAHIVPCRYDRRDD
jgi:hypothetical protein